MKLEAKEGYVYCNGFTYGHEICLPDNLDTSEWVLMTEEEAIALIKENEIKEVVVNE